MYLRKVGLAWIAVALMQGSSMWSQAKPSATGSPTHLQAGAVFSGFDTDVANHPFEYGIGAYADLRVWGGLGIEAEGRTIQFNETDNVRQDTISGGFRYSVNAPVHFSRKLSPYAKALAGVGSADFPYNTYKSSPLRRHDTFSTITIGGGLDYRIARHISLRGEYEYQFWLDYGRGNHVGLGVANPNGINVGLGYTFF